MKTTETEWKDSLRNEVLSDTMMIYSRKNESMCWNKVDNNIRRIKINFVEASTG